MSCNIYTDKITVLIVSSYSPFHPSTELFDTVIKSLTCIPFLENCSKVIVLDGYHTITAESEQPEIKRGKLSQPMIDSYEIYCNNLFERYKSSTNVQIIKNEKHIGFAHSVKKGLEAIDTAFAMILQHDRVFCECLPDHLLTECMNIMNSNDHIRYIGFPTSSSKTHISQITSRYQGIDSFNLWEHRIQLQTTDTQTDNIPIHNNDKNYYGYFLQPCIFWYDSNHLCHVQRYLNIFRPYKTIPLPLKELLGNKRIKKLLLRQGDFIEDRFGQMQRKILTEIIPQEIHPGNNTNNNKDTHATFLMDAFRWFGSYLLWQTDRRHIEKLASMSTAVFDIDDTTITTPSTSSSSSSSSSSSQDYLLTGVTSTVEGTVADCVNLSRVFVRHLHGRRKPYDTNPHNRSDNKCESDDSEIELEVRPDDEQDSDDEPTQHTELTAVSEMNRHPTSNNNPYPQNAFSRSHQSNSRHTNRTTVTVDWSKVSLEDSTLDVLFPA